MHVIYEPILRIVGNAEIFNIIGSWVAQGIYEVNHGLLSIRSLRRLAMDCPAATAFAFSFFHVGLLM